ncbi:MAG: glycoside hydrolase family 140 protein [Anaerolineales bacterium]|nr:glycoside hydrolase family 140 protein [Anaerolineales bacterium]
MERITVSANRRFLVTENGQPFFWLGDTAWELFHRCSRQEIEMYLENRRQKGFNVIQAVVLAELDGLHTPNMEAERPLVEDDPTRPNEAYFELVDYAIRLAAQKGIYIALLPTWGDKVTPMWGVGPQVFTPENAQIYGRWLGERYRNDANVLWVLGGDRPAIHEGRDYRPIWRAMAEGIDQGCGFHPFKTYHPMGGYSTSTWLQEEPWLDMHMIQSGHGGGRDVTTAWQTITQDYGLNPIRPILDGEPNYEDHPVSPWPKWDPANGYFRDYDVRKQVYRSVFAGGCGVTYGHHFIWQMWQEGRQVMNNGDEFIPWKTAIDRPGGAQVQHLKNLMLSRPYLTRIPDQGLLLLDPGSGASYVQATRDLQGRYAFVHFPQAGQTVEINLSPLHLPLRVSWYNPRTGSFTPAGEIVSQTSAQFTSPGLGEDRGPDWVLVLDSLSYPVE